jgi:anti-sigma factor RsiW
MNCDEVRHMLDAYLDGELDLIRHGDVEAHLPGCVNCKEAAEDKTQFCSLVRMNAPVYKGPPELRARIRAAFRRESKPRSGWLPQYSLPLAYAAAVLVLSIGLTCTWWTFYHAKNQALVLQAISNHVRSLIATHLTDVNSSDEYTLKAWFTGKLDYSLPIVDLEKAGFPLIGGRIDMLDQRPVAAIVYRHNNNSINLFVWPAMSRRIDLNVRSDRGYHFCGWNKAGLNYFCISEISSNALEAFEDQVREQTNW